MPNAFSDLAALEAHFRALGFVDQDGIADQSTTELYSRVLVPGDERSYLLSVHILAGEAIGRLEAGLTAYFDPPERTRVNADIASLAAALVDGAEGRAEAGRFLSATLEAGRDAERDFAGVRLLVVFPDRGARPDFEVAHVEASRPLEPGEWDAANELDTAVDEAVATCRAILRDRGHPLAERALSLTMSTDMGAERVDVFTTGEGASLWLTTRPKKKPKLSIIAPDGAHEEF